MGDPFHRYSITINFEDYVSQFGDEYSTSDHYQLVMKSQGYTGTIDGRVGCPVNATLDQLVKGI